MSSVHITSATFVRTFLIYWSLLLKIKRWQLVTCRCRRLPNNICSILNSTQKYQPRMYQIFLVVATKLVLHKSRQLIPQFFPEEEDGPSLEKQLSLYKAFVEASAHIQRYWEKRTTGFFSSRAIA